MEKGFDWAWNVVPQLSAYQLFIAIVSGYVAFIGNVSREKNEKVLSFILLINRPILAKNLPKMKNRSK